MTYSYPSDPNQFQPQSPHNGAHAGHNAFAYPKRPPVVTIAGLITVLHVILHVAMGALTAFTGMSEGDDELFLAVVVLMFSFVIGLGFLFLAIGVFRGMQAARIASIVAYGLFTGLCCLSNGLILGEVLVGSESMDEGLTVISVLSIVAMASYFVVLVLMVVPASREWFATISRLRREQRYLH
ncbi:MAG TPA: hypothetical protein H9902_10095, partial [Candidatus Stackebrandtia faecavium]|nr:hypothetical protein [Candidatus Stackebrandtia faecavium]